LLEQIVEVRHCWSEGIETSGSDSADWGASDEAERGSPVLVGALVSTDAEASADDASDAAAFSGGWGVAATRRTSGESTAIW
jgi:hypothetical protein